MPKDNTAITYEQFQADFADAATAMVAGVHEAMGEAPREVVGATLLEMAVARSHDDLAGLSVALLLALADEQGSHAMTQSSFEIFTESGRETEAKLRARIDRLETDAEDRARRHSALLDEYLRERASLIAERDEARGRVAS